MFNFWNRNKQLVNRVASQRYFARSVAKSVPFAASQAAEIFGDRTFITPTPMEEFDAHKHKMEVKHNNIQEIKWHDRTVGRNIFRFEPQFPDFENGYRRDGRDHESKIFKAGAEKAANEFKKRATDNIALTKLKQRLVKSKKTVDSQKSGPSEIELLMKSMDYNLELNYDPTFGEKETLLEINQRLDVKMDNLIEKLTRLDYRDFLAVNKYILEARNSKETHLQARAHVLAAAMRRISQKKRNQIDQELKNKHSLSDDVSNTSSDLADFRIKAFMEEDPHLKDVYRKSYTEIKEENTRDTADQDLDQFIDEEIYEEDEEDHLLEKEFYTHKYVHWFKTTKELRQIYEQDIGSAQTKEAKDIAHDKFINMRKRMLRKKKLAVSVESLRAELLYNHRIKLITKQKMLEEHKDRIGQPGSDFLENEISDLEKMYNQIKRDESPILKKGDATDEISQQWLEFMDKFSAKYYDSKWKWYQSTKIKQIVTMDARVSGLIQVINDNEGNLKDKMEYMYNRINDHNDRKEVRDMISAEIHKKTSIQDVGEVLDDLIREYEANNPEYEGNIEPESLYKEYTSPELFPHLYHVLETRRVIPSQYDARERGEGKIFKETFEEVDKNDQERDHSLESLDEHEKIEMQIYSSIKRDPYYKHYVYNCLRHESEYLNAKSNDLSMAIAADNYNMRVKFDPIEIPDLETKGYLRDFVEKITNGKAWGSGRRKTARAICAVKPGSGVITVNGKPIQDYFLLPHQRRLIVAPIKTANYTSVLDFELWVKGGGTSGQVGACLPAIAKALSRFDPQVRKKMELHRFVYSDGRVRERQHYGKKRARKGRVYKRR
ncbi:unnamed protein product [Moneuplotes crassus]|uniref:Ribosomal protein S9 n=1 Tax=Euplotes crassus TaxID=5936 RepID=A0AAD1Y5T1_EUPCR|nr:unnamed protein product [Moneuplotes crassus]